VPFDSDREAMEVKRLALQQALDRLTEEAEACARGDRYDCARHPIDRDAP